MEGNFDKSFLITTSTPRLDLTSLRVTEQEAMGSQEQQQQKKHIVMMPFMAQGHIIPFLSLANLIQQRYPNSYTITLVSTPLNINNLEMSALPPSAAIRLRSLPYRSSDHGLPPDTENTDSLPYPLFVRLFESSKSLQPHFDRLISDITEEEGRPPVCVIADMFFGWTVAIAREHGVFHTTYGTCGGYGSAAYFALWQHLPHLNKADDEEFGVPGFPDTFRLRRNQLANHLRAADGNDPWSRFLQEQLPLAISSKGFICNTVEELETTGLRLLRQNTGIPVWPVVPSLLNLAGTAGDRTGKKAGISTEACIQWLDTHTPSSVLYASFGSQNTITAPQMMALAKALEASGVAFLWVVRPPIGFDLKHRFRDEWLPEGFEERVKDNGRGLLVRNWAPQVEILSHKAVGAFLSHCGWNSTLESLSKGVPIVAWPLSGEQFYNSKMLEEELGVCVEVARGTVEDVDSGVVERAVKSVMGGQKGEEMRRRAAELAVNIADGLREEGEKRGSCLRALDEFMEAATGLTHRVGVCLCE